MRSKSKIASVGMYSSTTALVMTIIFAFAIVIGFWLTGFSNILSYVVCFILAPAFVLMTISIHLTTPIEKRIWSQAGVAFAIIYAVFITLTYYTQLLIVFNPPKVSEEIIKVLNYQETASWIFAVDMLGYGFMTLSTLFTAFSFSQTTGLEKWLKRIFIFHGIFVLPTLVFPLIPMNASTEESKLFGSLALIFWCLIFIPLSGLLTIYFKSNLKEK